jgi:hypothetical protein
MGWFKQSTVSEGAIGESQSDKRACLVFLLAQFSASGVGVELPPVLRGGVVEQPAQWIVFRHSALDVLGAIRRLVVGLSAPMEVYQLLLSPADPPVSDVAIPVRMVDRGSYIELVTHGRQEPRAFRFIIFVFVDVMVQITRGNSQASARRTGARSPPRWPRARGSWWRCCARESSAASDRASAAASWKASSASPGRCSPGR